MDVEAEENVFPWSQPEVRELHKLFDAEVVQVQSQQQMEALFHRFFAPEGLLEEKLRACQEDDDVECDDVLEMGFELYTFKSLVFTNLFLENYPEEMVEEWWETKSLRPWMEDDSYFETRVKKLKQAFDKETDDCTTPFDLEELRDKYLSPNGFIAKESQKIHELKMKEQVGVATELFGLKSYIEITLFVMEHSLEVEEWTVPEVRDLENQLEIDLDSISTEKEFRAIEGRYLGKDGLIETQLKQLKGKKGEMNLKHAEELGCLRDSVQAFFSSQRSDAVR